MPKRLMVYRSAAFFAAAGANLGDKISFADELVLDDIYELREDAGPTALTVRFSAQLCYSVDQISETGRKGAQICLDSAITLMPPTGATIEALLIVEVDDTGFVEEVYVHPLAPLSPKTPYALVGIERSNLAQRVALLNCVSFTSGTRITTATGTQKPIEDLRPGDEILTRDAGVQKLRWIGQSTVRASGDLAPVVIKQGTLHNLADLKVSQDHRLFIYQRRDEIGAGQAEVMIRAGDLVNGENVLLQEGGFVDYFQLLFDEHQIVFAEGIAVETLLVTQANAPVLPEDMNKTLEQNKARATGSLGFAREIDRNMISPSDALAALRRASLH